VFGVSGRLKKKIEEWLAENRTFLWTVMSHKEMADTSLRGTEDDLETLLEVCEKIEASLDEVKMQLRRIYTLLYEIMDDAQAQVARKRGEEVGVEAKPRRRPPALTVRRASAAVEREEVEKEVAAEEKSDVAAAQESAPVTNREPHVTTIEVPIVDSSQQQVEGSAGKQEEVAAEVAAASQQVECKVLDELDRKGAREVKTAGIVLKKPPEPGGLIDFLGLWDWFWALDPQKQAKAVSIMCEGGLTEFDLFERKITTLRPSFARYCWETANLLMQNDLDELATGLLNKGLTIVDTRHDKEMLHIMYAKYFYRRRHKLKNAYNACISHCMKVIKSYQTDKERKSKPVAPFKLLTMIYEEKGEYEKILEICDEAIKLYEATSERSRAEGFKRIKEILLQRMGRRG